MSTNLGDPRVRPDPPSPLARPAGLAVAILLTVAATWVLAHQGHAPTRGAQVNAATGQVVLSRDARESLDVQTAEVASRPVTESLLAYATLTSPWQNHAIASSRVGGRVVAANGTREKSPTPRRVERCVRRRSASVEELTWRPILSAA